MCGLIGTHYWRKAVRVRGLTRRQASASFRRTRLRASAPWYCLYNISKPKSSSDVKTPVNTF
jgi:hypothetical protein